MTFQWQLTMRHLGQVGLTGMACLAAPRARAQEGAFRYSGTYAGRSPGRFCNAAQVAAGLSDGASVTGISHVEVDVAGTR